MPKVSEAHREAQRAEILDAARRCFAENGFHATSMQDILDASGKSAGAVYGYFAGKSDLVAAIAGQNVDTVLTSLEACTQARPELSVADAVGAAIERIRQRHTEHATASIAIQVWAESARDPLLQEQFAETHLRFRRALRGVLARRHPDRSDLDALAAAVSALLPGYMVQLALLGDDGGHVADGVRALLRDL